MKEAKLNRRDFLKASLMGLAWSALAPLEKASASYKNPRFMLVGNKKGASVFKEPDDRSVIMYQRQYNEIITVYDEVIGPNGPAFNPIWYKCWGGYVFSGDLYEVKYQYNEMKQPKYKTGQLAEVTVPYTRSMYYSRTNGWEPLWLFYYKSTHWVMDIFEGPDGLPWYKVHDELGKTETAVRPEHLRLIPDEEFAPISPDVPVHEKRIEINSTHQVLRAMEAGKVVFERKISTGYPAHEGKYAIRIKMPTKHMGDALLTRDDKPRIFMGVPWTSFFETELGLAIHGAFWHMNFGTPMSAGCINMAPDDSKWIYRWSTPIAKPDVWTTNGVGTVVEIVK